MSFNNYSNKKSSDAIAHNFKLKRDIISYLNKYNFHQQIEEELQALSNLSKDVQIYTTIVIPLRIDYRLAADLSNDLALELISNPLNFESEVRDIIYIFLRVILDTSYFQPDQIFVNIIPMSVPTTNYIFINGLCSFKAVLIEHSKQQKYIMSTTYECSNHKDSPIFFKGLPANDERCELCGGILQELVSYRNMGDIITGIFIDDNCLKMNNYGTRFQVVPVELKDSNICEIELGAVYNITGVQETNFIAWHCEKYIYRPIKLEHNKIFQKFSQYRDKSPWMFVYILAMNIGSEKYPPMSFINLKIGILLSLASLNEISNPVPIFAFGDDSLIANQLFLSASFYADRFVCSTVNQNLSGQKRTDWYEANNLLLSKGGVCYLGDWDKYQKEKDAFIVRLALESNSVNFEDFSLPLRSTIWTYWTKPTKNKNLTQLQTLINVFGIPFISDPIEHEEELIDFIISKHTTKTPSNSYKINDNQMKEFLLAVSRQNVTVSENARKLLSDYFVASRKLRPGCLPIRALEHLTSFAEAYARLNLRTEVICEDVIAIISLYEESMEIIFGTCAILPSYKKDIRYVDDIDGEMTQFTNWLKDFLHIEN